MGRLLDPKLYPAKTGPHPESEATRFDQPSTYMRKSTPIDEVIKRVDEDRLKTTYQLDYSEKAAAQMEEVATGPCAPKQREEEIDCQVSTRSRRIAKRDEHDKDKKEKKKKSMEDESQETRLPPWRSEYQDSISRVGQAIMKQKIHHKKTAAPLWAMAIF
ncbi:unnamed protein product [Xylocopa violacea]|uniref:Uncharacterized protein n=1 Tax=Xylocopa violacea TaxID=135666 RepID=A0ABP1N7L0_XYLVO